jgi:diguanylate cyclase (GGDEF)-like protein
MRLRPRTEDLWRASDRPGCADVAKVTRLRGGRQRAWSVRRLFAVYAAVTLVPVVLLGMVLVDLLRDQASSRGLGEGVSQAQLVARSTIAPLLDDGALSDLSPLEYARLKRSVGSSITAGQILRLRLRDQHGVVVFTSDRTFLGVGDGDGAEQAIHGQTVARLTRLNEDSPREAVGPRVVEVYLPLHASGDGKQIGVVELYLPYAPIAAEISRGERTVFGALAIGLLLLWLCLTAVSVSVIRRLRRESAAHAYLAGHDVLTGLANRARFGELVTTTAAEACELGATVALLNLDRFRQVNDALGHANADQVLVTIADRLRDAVGDTGSVARLDGDEFGIVLRSFDGDREMALHHLRDVVQAPLEIDGLPLSVEATIGYAVTDCAESAELLRRADTALTVAKREHRGLLGYAPGQDGHNAAALSLVSQLRSAVNAGELVLHYQPKYNVSGNTFSSVEGLVRWQHPERGLLFPDAFLDAVEQTELIDDLTRWVLSEACHAAAVLDHYGVQYVAVNISARSLVHPRFADDVINLVTRSGTDPRHIVLEITETAVMTNPQRAVHTLRRLREAGFQISIDDFGAGQTSLSHLVMLPVDELKIDRTFVMHMLDDPRSAAIVRTVIELGHSLGVTVTAEGVETDTVLDAVRELHCDTAQGYLFSRPVPLAAILGLIIGAGNRGDVAVPV